MINKTIKVNDVGILAFLYPNFKIKSELIFSDMDSNIIYNGPYKKGLIPYLQRGTNSYINTIGPADIDISKPELAIEWIYSTKGVELSNNLKESISNYDEDYFWYCFKIFWVTGKWIGEKEDSKYNLFHLFFSTVQSKKEILEIYFNLCNGINSTVIESSFLTFLSRVKNINNQNVSVAYMKLLKSADSKYGDKIKIAVSKMATKKGLTPELLFIDLITDLR